VAHVLTALHGFTGHPDDFEALRERVPGLWRGPVLYGHSRTRAPTLPRAWETVTSALAADLVPDTVLVGYSMGGRLALQVAADAPERLLGLILIGATPGIADPAARAERRAADHGLAERILSLPLQDFLAEWSEKPIIASQRAIPEPYQRRVRDRKLRLRPDGLASSLRGVGTGSMPPLWERLPSVPTLLLTGAGDTKFTRIAAEMAARMPRAEHTLIEGVGHCAHLEAPDAAAAEITAFLQRLPGPG